MMMTCNWDVIHVMCFGVQRRLSTVIRIVVAVGFMVFIMRKYYFCGSSCRRPHYGLHPHVCLSARLICTGS